jgi:dihydroneopterin aldolase
MVADSVNYRNACWIYVNTISEETNIQLFEKLANEIVKGCVIVSTNSTEHSSFKELNNITLPTNLYNSRVYVYVKI